MVWACRVQGVGLGSRVFAFLVGVSPNGLEFRVYGYKHVNYCLLLFRLQL